MHLLKPLDPPYHADTEKLLEVYPKRDGYLLALFRTLAMSPRHLAKIGAAGLLDRGSPLAIKEREIVILRTTANLKCAYEWGVHVTAFAQHAGLTDQQVQATFSDVQAATWSAREMLLLRVVDGLSAVACLDTGTLDAMRSTWTVDEQLEIVSLVGFYHTISFVVAVAAIELEPWAAQPPGR